VTTTAKSTKASAAAAGYYYAAVALMLHGVVETEWTLQMTNAFESMLERALTNLGYDINSISLAGIAVVSHEPVDSVEVVARVEVRGTFEDVEAMKTTVMASVDKNNFSSLTTAYGSVFGNLDRISVVSVQLASTQTQEAQQVPSSASSSGALPIALGVVASILLLAIAFVVYRYKKERKTGVVGNVKDSMVSGCRSRGIVSLGLPPFAVCDIHSNLDATNITHPLVTPVTLLV